MGNTALYVAIRQKNNEVVKALIKVNARTDIVFEFGKTAIDLAEENGINLYDIE
jgi:ankyrin repeat protein